MNTYEIYYYDSNYYLVDNGETVKEFKRKEHAISFARNEMNQKNAKHFEIYQRGKYPSVYLC